MTPSADHYPEITVALPGEWFRVDPADLDAVNHLLRTARTPEAAVTEWNILATSLDAVLVLVRLRGGPPAALAASWTAADASQDRPAGATSVRHVADWDVWRVHQPRGSSQDSAYYIIRGPVRRRCLTLTFTAMNHHFDDLEISGFDTAAGRIVWDR